MANKVRTLKDLKRLQGVEEDSEPSEDIPERFKIQYDETGNMIFNERDW